MKKIACSMTALLLAAGSASAIPVYSNMTNPSGGFNITNFDNQVLLDDLLIAGGGELQDITVTMSFSGGGFGGPSSISIGADVALYLDDGDGQPQIIDGTDVLLWNGVIEPTTVGLGQTLFPTLDISPGVMVNAGDRLWLGIRYHTDATSFVNFGTEMYDDFTVGSSDNNIYILDLDNNNQVSPFPATGGGMGAILTVVPAPGVLAPLAVGGLFVTRRRR
ncbi:MAG: hypothetical protein JJU33_03500 [Phycisphaerales bacterium]|nr:hypothetical protein [Phycisphaerales bacterium]